MIERPAGGRADTVIVGAAVAASVLGVVAVADELLLRLSPGAVPVAWVATAAAASMLLLAVAVVRAVWLRSGREYGPAHASMRLLGTGMLVLTAGVSAAIVAGNTSGARAGLMVFGVVLLLAGPMLGWSVAQLCWPRRLTRGQRRGVLADTVLAAFALATIWWLWIVPVAAENSPGWPAGARLEAWLFYAGAVFLVLLTAAARGRAYLPFGQLLLVHAALGLLLLTSLLELVLPQERASQVPIFLLGYVIAGLLIINFAGHPAGAFETPSDRWWREWYAALVPLLPLPTAVAVMVTYLVSGSRDLIAGSEVLGVLTVVALLTGLVVLRALASSELRGAVRQRAERQLAASTQEKWFLALVGRTQDLVLVLDGVGRIEYATPSVPRLTGRSTTALRKLSLHQICAAGQGERDSQAVIAEALARAESNPGEPTAPVDLVVPDAMRQPHEVEWEFTAVQGLDFDGYLAHGRDVTADRRMRSLLAEATRRDRLTGLLGREGFLSLPVDQGGGKPCVLAVNLMRFGRINDRLGHEAGDEALRATAALLRQLPGPLTNPARISGDTFAVQVGGMLPDIEVVAAVAELRESLQQLRLGDHRVPIDISAGYAVAEADGVGMEDLVAQAELALAHSRQLDRSPLVRYEVDLREATAAAAEVEENLRSALRDQELVVLYQPIIRLSDHSVASVEALVRRRRADGSLEPPHVFISLAEDLGLVDQIDYAVLGRALSDLRWVAAKTGSRIPVAVNVSPSELDEGFEHRVLDALAEADWLPRDLTIEVTETVATRKPAQAYEMLERLRAHGCRIALDDFGTGYATVAALADTPLDIIKIDSSFTARLSSGDRGLALMRVVVDVGRSLGLTTVAEGLATVEQADLLRGMGCELAQGYLYAEPLTVEQLADFLQPDPSSIPAV